MSPRTSSAKALNPEWVRTGATLRSFREKAGLTPAQAANLIPISGPYFRNIERGAKRVTPVLLARFAEIYGVPQIAIARPDLYAEVAAS